MKCFVIEKWLEPYVILEKFKERFECHDLTFDGFSKNKAKENMLSIIENSDNCTVGIYMKNVNKFYVMTSREDDALKCVFEDLNLVQEDIKTDSVENGIMLVDIARAEFIVVQKD